MRKFDNLQYSFRRMRIEPTIEIYPPRVKDLDGVVYVAGAIIGAIALVALVLRWI